MAQRRQVLDTGVGVSALQSFVTQFAAAQQERRSQKQKVSEMLLGSQLKREEQAIDPEFQAKQEALRAIQELAPLPSLRVSPQAPSEARGRLQELFQGRMRERLGERAKLSELFGLAPKRQPTLAETAAEFQALQQMMGQSEGTQFEPSISGAGKPILRPTAASEAARQAEIRGATKRAELEATTSTALESLGGTIKVLTNRLSAIPAPKSDPGGLLTRGIVEFGAKRGFSPAINEYLTTADAILGQIARAVSQERGNLHNKDIERVANLVRQLPFLSGPSRQIRMETINALMGKMGQAPLFPEMEVAQAQEGQTATNSQTGERLIFRNGTWQKL